MNAAHANWNKWSATGLHCLRVSFAHNMIVRELNFNIGWDGHVLMQSEKDKSHPLAGESGNTVWSPSRFRYDESIEKDLVKYETNFNYQRDKQF